MDIKKSNITRVLKELKQHFKQDAWPLCYGIIRFEANLNAKKFNKLIKQEGYSIKYDGSNAFIVKD